MLGWRDYHLPNPRKPGSDMVVTVDLGDYPKLLVEGAVDDEDNGLQLTQSEEIDVYLALGPKIAGDLADEAMDLLEDR